MLSNVAITDEVYWDDEYTPASLLELRRRLATFFRVPLSNIGTKGNTAHRRGYHRSYRWIRSSAFSTNRTYSVTETPGNRSPGDVNWICAMDVTVPTTPLIEMCARLDKAVRAGTLEKITEWYGNDDGDNRVDGYDNIRNVVASSDSSHLWHLHMSFDRGAANEDHNDLYEVLTGVDMTPLQDARLEDINNILTAMANGADSAKVHDKDGILSLSPFYNKIASAVPTPPPAPIDTEAVRALIREELDKTRLTG